MNNYKKHEKLLKSCLLDAQKRWPDSRIFKRDVGFFKTLRDTPIKIGLKGQADCYAYIPYGENSVLWVELEFKTGKAVQTKEQKSWQETVENLRGFYLVVRDSSDLDKVNEEINSRMKLNCL